MKNILENEIDSRIEMLKINFPECFDRNGNFNLQKFDETINPSIKTFKDSYGINWLGKSYAKRLTSVPISTVLQEDLEHNSQEINKNSENIYIKGDNLEVLRHLSSAYSNKVKLIYIDPPYNTKNGEFIYNDNREFSEKELGMMVEEEIISDGEKNRILEWTDKKSSSHSAWLTFMYPRLYLARKLLKDDGVIFISIDDNENAQLKLLCDEIFGEENFIAIFPWKKRSAKSDVPFGVSQDYEWILAYTKKNFIAGLEFGRKYYSSDDYPNDRWRLSDLTTQKVEADRPNSAFDLVDPKTGKIYKYNPNRLWGITKDTFEDYYSKGKIVFPDDYDFLNTTIPSYRVFESEDKKKALEKYGSLNPIKAMSTHLEKSVGMNTNGNKEIIELLNKKVFSYPKPSSLIEYLISSIPQKEYIVLDFFSGSGTTAHAVMQLNANDEGNRKYIMVQLEEELAEGTEGYKYCIDNNLPTNITSIGIERIKKSAEKIKKEKNADIDYGFKIYSIKDVPNKLILDDSFDPTVKTLFEKNLLTEDEKNALLTTYKVFDGNLLSENIKSLFIGENEVYLIQDILYILNEIRSENFVKELLEKIDKDKEFIVNRIVIYGYESTDGKFRKELTENIKSYNNKKNATINVEVRY